MRVVPSAYTYFGVYPLQKSPHHLGMRPLVVAVALLSVHCTPPTTGTGETEASASSSETSTTGGDTSGEPTSTTVGPTGTDTGGEATTDTTTDPTTGEPTTDPTTGEPTTDATTEDPTTGEPTTEDPTTDATTDPTTGDPTTGDPTTEDPTTTTTGDPGLCPPAPGDDDCTLCVKDTCCAELIECFDNTRCECWVNCTGEGHSGQVCGGMCQGPPNDLFWDLADCADECPSCG